jgi:hypothetical protein
MANFSVLQVSAVGVQVTTGAASAQTAIPVAGGGVTPKFVRLQALANCYVRCGVVGVVATVNDLLLSPNEAVILNVRGCSTIASIQETAAAKFNITPLDDF